MRLTPEAHERRVIVGDTHGITRTCAGCSWRLV
jgi:hypothetical protein